MSRKNLFTGEPSPPNASPPTPKNEPIARILARAQATNPLPHQRGHCGLSGLGAGRRSGSLARGHRRKERATTGRLFGIPDGPTDQRRPTS